MISNKKFILKPGNHQFVQGEHAVHNNDNMSDEAAAWYLNVYPHISGLFEQLPDSTNSTVNQAAKPKRKRRAKANCYNQLV